MNLTWLAEACRKHGLKVTEHPGWQTRGRPYTFEPHAVVFHHTASNKAGGAAPAVHTVTAGRLPDLPGPLCQVLIGRDNRVHIIASGYANHGGYGGPYLDIPLNSANKYSVGIEVENDGIGEPWPEKQLEVVAMVGAILLNRFKRPRRYFFAHKEWTSRKIDPARIDMVRFRRRVGKQMRELRNR